MTPKRVSIELSGKMKRAFIPMLHTLMAQNQLDMPNATTDQAYSILVSQNPMFYTKSLAIYTIGCLSTMLMELLKNLNKTGTNILIACSQYQSHMRHSIASMWSSSQMSFCMVLARMGQCCFTPAQTLPIKATRLFSLRTCPMEQLFLISRMELSNILIIKNRFPAC